VVSVDLVYGYRSRLWKVWWRTCRLAQNGVEGFAVPAADIVSNRGILQHYGSPGKARCTSISAHAAEQALHAEGFRKTLFPLCPPAGYQPVFHLPGTGRDCLALGTIADSVWHAYRPGCGLPARAEAVSRAGRTAAQGGKTGRSRWR
jgi:hypothetical protein